MYQMSSIPMPRSKDYEAFLAEEKRESDAKIQRVIDQQNAELKKGYQSLLKALGKTWNQQLGKIFAAWQSGKRAAMLPYYFDLILRPTNADGSPIPEGVQSADDATKEFSTFVETLPTKYGFRLSTPFGLQRFQLWVYISTFCGRHLVNQENLKRYFDALVDSEAFDAQDIIYDPSLIVKAQPEPKREVSPDDFESLNLSSEDGRRQGIKIAQELFGIEFAPVVDHWASSLLTRFGLSLTPQQGAAVQQWMERRNKAITFDSLEECRRSLVRATIFPATALDLEDLRCVCLEVLPTSDKDSIRIARFGSLSAVKELMSAKGIRV